MLSRCLIALALLLAAADIARADPITTAIFGSAFAASWMGQVVSFVIATGVTFLGNSLLQRATKPDAIDAGVQLQVEIGDDTPIGFVGGTGATAGTRRYSGVWGKSGDTPNAYLVDVIQVGDLPAPGQPGIWVNGEKGTILWDEPSDDGRGFPVQEFRKSGKDYLWVKYRDGTDTSADAYLFSKLGGDPDRPYTEDMVGRGCPHVIITARFNRDLFPGQMQWMIEPPPIPLYDVRKDSTAGGSGAHRWNDWTTWEPSDNNVVLIYNIIRGIYYQDEEGEREWLYGGQDLPSFRLPAANWIAAANECDAAVDLADGGTEKQFRCGLEVRGDMEPLSAIEEVLKACNGRLAEVGGIFKIMVGAPPAAVYSFTDDDVIITKGQSLRPFPTLDETINGIEATYPEPAEMWASKDAPARYSPSLEEEDGDRQLLKGLKFDACPFSVQVQRLMKAILAEERRFRMHSFWLPPDAWLLEPAVDVVSWSSARNGYSNKKFLLYRVQGEKTKNQLVILKEIDPGDYSWSAAIDERPVSIGYLGPIRPPPQLMVGWQAQPFTITEGAAARPAIKVLFDGDQDDVQFVHVQARLASTEEVVFDGTSAYGEPAAGNKSIVLNGQFLPSTQYEVSGRFIPYTGRETVWSEWLPVTTSNVGINRDELDPALNSLFDQLDITKEAALANALAKLNRDVEVLANNVNGMWAHSDAENGRTLRAVGAKFGTSLAQFVEIVEAAVTNNTALIQALNALVAQTDSGIAEGLVRFVATSAPTGVAARFSVEVRATMSDEFVEAGFYVDAGVTALGGASRILMKADQIFFEVPGGATIYEDGIWTAVDGLMVFNLKEGWLTVDDGAP